MSHREDLLAGAVQCLRDKGYARTTARDIVAASGTNLASIGYHYGSVQALLNAAVVHTMDEFGTAIGKAMAASTEGSLLMRFERFWTLILDSIRTDSNVWAATFDMVTVAQREPDVRAVIADGLEDGRLLWARTIAGDAADPATLRAVGALFQALLSGVLAQYLIDPERAPSAADLAHALAVVAARIADDDNAR
jgi:AcrR family transcriptional regulator